MNELKPEDVMRALECCAVYANCNGCPHFNGVPEDDCHYKVMANALALLKKYQAENAEKDAEIERLTTLAELGKMRANDYRAMREKAKNARAEAITEFLARAYIKAREMCDLKPFVTIEDLEEIAKEMKEENK